MHFTIIWSIFISQANHNDDLDNKLKKEKKLQTLNDLNSQIVLDNVQFNICSINSSR